MDYSSFTWAFSRILRDCVYPFNYVPPPLTLNKLYIWPTKFIYITYANKRNCDYFSKRHSLLGCVMETQNVFCAVGSGYLNIT